jgi:hypothetical protein
LPVVCPIHRANGVARSAAVCSRCSPPAAPLGPARPAVLFAPHESG